MIHDSLDVAVAIIALFVAVINGAILLYQNSKLKGIHTDINGRVAELVALRVRAEMAELMLIRDRAEARKGME